MGFLLGLPLRLLGLVFGLIRFLIPVALLVLLGNMAVSEVRRTQTRRQRQKG